MANKNGNGKKASKENSSHVKFNRDFLLISILVTAVAFFWIVNIFVVDVILAATFTTLFYPLYNWILRRIRGNRTIASLICCFILLLGLLLPVFWISTVVVDQSVKIFRTAQDAIEQAMDDGGNEFIQRIEQWPIVESIDLSEVDWTTLQSALDRVGGIAGQVIARTYHGVFGLVMTVFVVFFSMFYFFRDGPAFTDKLKMLSPLNEKYENAIISKFVMISRATVKGTLLIGLIEGGIGGLTLLVLGVTGWALWGVIMIIFSVIPMLGPGLIMVPAGIYQIMVGNVVKGVIIILVTVLVISIIDNLLRPRLVGRDAKMHDLLIFFSTIGGLSVFGVMGFIVGPVITALFLTVLEIYTVEFKGELELPKDTKL